ncbi:MAG: hypothetical protein ACLQU2_22805 [Candidatus Binataceae bacterium]
MSVADTIRRDSKSYRQGMVLGLTMAETLLLLVFCLLIAAASVFSYKVKQLKEAQLDEQTLRDDLGEAQNKIDVMQRQMPGGVITDDWEHLVRDYPNINRLNKAGVFLKEAADAADVVAAAIQAKKNGATAQDVTNSIAFQQVIKKELSGSPDGMPSNEQVASIIREGRQALTAATSAGQKGKHDWPPIITLSEADGNYFATGSAVLSDTFRAALKGKVMDELLRNIAAYPEVNVIEVIGHTDERPVGGQNSNLDAVLLPVLRGKESVVRIKPVDNAGLGLARAVSVSQVLMQDERLATKFSILPYSAAQLVNVNDTISLTGTGGDVRERRRIEIRLRESDKFRMLPVAALPLPALPRKPTPPPTPADEVIVPKSASVPDESKPVPKAPSAPGPPRGLPFRWIFGN